VKRRKRERKDKRRGGGRGYKPGNSSALWGVEWDKGASVGIGSEGLGLKEQRGREGREG
jgi:hypothetical protein